MKIETIKNELGEFVSCVCNECHVAHTVDCGNARLAYSVINKFRVRHERCDSLPRNKTK